MFKSVNFKESEQCFTPWTLLNSLFEQGILDLAGIGLDDLQMGMGMFAANTLSSTYWRIDPNTYSADLG